MKLRLSNVHKGKKKSRRWIDPKKAVKYELVDRPVNDVLSYDVEAPQKIFRMIKDGRTLKKRKNDPLNLDKSPVVNSSEKDEFLNESNNELSDNNSLGSFDSDIDFLAESYMVAPNRITETVLVPVNQKKIPKKNKSVNNQYNYEKHLKSLNGFTDSVFYSKDGKKIVEPSKNSFDLGPEFFESVPSLTAKEAESYDLKFGSSEIIDEDIQKFLDDDDDDEIEEENSENLIDDDFVSKAIQPTEDDPLDVKTYLDLLIKGQDIEDLKGYFDGKKNSDFENTLDEIDDEDFEYKKQNNEFEKQNNDNIQNIKKAQVAKNISGRQNLTEEEAARALSKFEKILLDYENFDQNEVDVNATENVNDFVDIMDEFIDEAVVLGLKSANLEPNLIFKNLDENSKENQTEFENTNFNKFYLEESDSSEYDFISVEEENPYDVESFVSTYTNTENHPRLIDNFSVTKRIQISSQGIPIGVLEHKRKKDASLQKSLNKASDSLRPEKKINLGIYRPKNETPEERKLRKQIVKEEKKINRNNKKELKLAFKNEKSKQSKNLNKIRPSVVQLK